MVLGKQRCCRYAEGTFKEQLPIYVEISQIVNLNHKLSVAIDSGEILDLSMRFVHEHAVSNNLTQLRTRIGLIGRRFPFWFGLFTFEFVQD